MSGSSRMDSCKFGVDSTMRVLFRRGADRPKKPRDEECIPSGFRRKLAWLGPARFFREVTLIISKLSGSTAATELRPGSKYPSSSPSLGLPLLGAALPRRRIFNSCSCNASSLCRSWSSLSRKAKLLGGGPGRSVPGDATSDRFSNDARWVNSSMSPSNESELRRECTADGGMRRVPCPPLLCLGGNPFGGGPLRACGGIPPGTPDIRPPRPAIIAPRGGGG
jgi:hypothetical protein